MDKYRKKFRTKYKREDIDTVRAKVSEKSENKLNSKRKV